MRPQTAFTPPKTALRRWPALFCLAALITSPSAVTLEQLQSDPELTPRKFASHFGEFRYKFHVEVQPPAQFLATESGDCDDYATLAAEVLRAKGYAPRLVTVRMPGLTHVVCYVPETRSYLDYNNRIYLSKLASSKPGLADIAAKVAKSFDSSWTSASEFVWTNQVKRMVETVSKTDRYASATSSTNAPPAPVIDLSF